MTGIAAEHVGEGGAAAAPAQRKPWFAPYRGVRLATSLRWLLAGALIYALLLLVALAGYPSDVILPFLGPSLYLTPLFGLPFVLRTMHRPGRLRRLFYFLLLLPLAHAAAIYVAWDHALSTYALDSSGEIETGLLSGAIGGLIGATLSFTLLYLMRLTARRRAELATMMLATIALTLLGAVGMAAGVVLGGGSTGATHDVERLTIGFECVHLPWQVLFAVSLAWLMRPPRAPKRATPH